METNSDATHGIGQDELLAYPFSLNLAPTSLVCCSLSSF
jgi:hypothetical protein